MLTAWHGGKYEKGLEKRFRNIDDDSLVQFCRDMLDATRKGQSPTIAEVYAQFFEWKYGEFAARRRSASSRNATAAAYQSLRLIHHRQMDEITVNEMQIIVNEMGLPKEKGGKGYSESAVKNAVSLIRQLYRFALERDLCRKHTGMGVVVPWTREQIHHDAFTDEELALLWDHREDPVVRMILVMCYSGFRISAYETMETNLEERYFRGGVKTDAGKGRVVPVHSALLPLLQSMVASSEASGDPSGDRGAVRYLCGKSSQQFRRDMKQCLAELGLREMTPHSCRHTFNRLLETAGVNEADRKRLMGHSLKRDLINGTYGHRGLEELREQVEKIVIL